MDAEALENLLQREPGLFGRSDISSDTRELLDSDQAAARQTVALSCDRVVQEIAALVATLGGLDALIFTAGIGERSAVVRAEICRHLAWLTLVADETANTADKARTSAPGSGIGRWIMPAKEELCIARHSRVLLASHGAMARS